MEIMTLYAAMAWSCSGPVELNRPITDIGSGWQGRDDQEEIEKTKSLYVTGVEYPDGYDWRQDLGYSTGGCKVFLMKDGQRVFEAEVGYSSCISADADMHRCIDGHLYTDFSTDMETIVKRDGAEVFRYFGREMISEMIVRTDGIYTIGLPRSGSGWTYRRNGEILLHKGSGSLISELHEDMGKLYFAYEDQLESSTGTINRYYLVENAKPSSIQATDDVLKIESARMIDGTLHYTAQLKALAPRVLFRGSDCQSYGMSHGSTMRNCKIVYSQGGIFTHGEVLVNGRYEDWFWKDTGPVARASYPVKAIGWRTDTENVYFAASTTAAGHGVAIFNGKNLETLPAYYDFLYSTAIGADRGRCCIGLISNLAGNRPALWIDGKITEYDFNGAFTSVSYW
ncbi:MAG: hypothetical protein NC308_04590 [Clostridium sp.]|nr:hypothetical protein [Bacteroides sp.]MCM1198145.1 hypothetical protein [Clostridium sp.]